MSNDNIDIMRHSTAHVLAAAITKLYPSAKFGVGPVIENGFYYDVLIQPQISATDLKKIEKTMQQIISSDQKFNRREMLIDEVIEFFQAKGQDFKVELLRDLKSSGTTKISGIDLSDLGTDENASKVDKVSVYETGEFTDLCRGPHLQSTSQIGSFKLTKIAGAYWRGDETKPQMQRIYGVAFTTDEQMKKYFWQVDEAIKRDHRKLGAQLDLFVFSDLVGAGLPLWTPRGTVVRRELDNFVADLRSKFNYQAVTIPHITKKDLYEKSGHWSKFRDELFRIKSRDGHDFAIKPMNCPHHTQIYAARPRSYRELPIRYSETTMVYRDEQSGELQGLERIRGGITQDDAHVFCRESQIDQEINQIWDIIEKFYHTFDIKLKVRLSRRGIDDSDSYAGDESLWQAAESTLESLIKTRIGDDFIDGAGEAAFYGPKLDFIGTDSLGRQLQVGTIQLDFNMPTNFDLSCINEKGESERVVMIHCAIAGSIERCLALLIEHFAGALPVWLAPTQVEIIPVSEKYSDYAKQVLSKLSSAGVRTLVSDSDESLGKRIRAAELMKVPYVLVVGEKESDTSTVAVRKYGEGDKGVIKLTEFVEKITTEISSRNL